MITDQAVTKDSRQDVSSRPGMGRARALARLFCFFFLIGLSAWGLDWCITAGLRRTQGTIFGVSNRIVRGSINADIVISGSSRAASHYDPRLIAAETGSTAINLGRNGSQTDMQVAVFQTYMRHNRAPKVVLHNLDAFSFQTSREVYNFAQYVPYLNEPTLYEPLQKIDPNTYKSRYLPLYGYIVTDMSFSWLKGLSAWLPRSSSEDDLDGFDPRDTPWSNEFDQFQADNPHGVTWDIEEEGVRLIEELAELCQKSGSQLVLVYSPEYAPMQEITANRAEVFARFKEIATKYNLQLWDYSDWPHAADTRYFTNSQHLNATGARAFSQDLASRLKDLNSAPPASPAPGHQLQTQ